MKFAPFAHDLHSPNKRSSRSGNAHAFVAVRRHGCGDCMGKTQVCARSSQARGDPFRHPHDAIDDCVHWLAPFGDSALGGLLSLALFYIVGILPFTSPLPGMRPTAMVMSFCRRCGGPWVRWKASSAC